MELKLIIISAIFLTVNSATPNVNNRNTRPSKSGRILTNGNRGSIRLKNRPNFRIVIPDTITTHRPKSMFLPSTTVAPTTPSSKTYRSQSHQVPKYKIQNHQSQVYRPQRYHSIPVQTANSDSYQQNHQIPHHQTKNFPLMENYQQKYQAPNYQRETSKHYQSQKYPFSGRNTETETYQPQKYVLRNSELQNYQPEKHQSNYQNDHYERMNNNNNQQKYQPHYQESNYQLPNIQYPANFENPSSQVHYVPESMIDQSENLNSGKNVVISKKEHKHPETIGSFSSIVSTPSYAIVPATQKPVLKIVKKIAYSPANEVSHVVFNGSNGKIFYKW